MTGYQAFGHDTPEYWEGLYADGPDDAPIDVLLPDVVAGLSPGTALDVGCGEGQNSLWLAERGWSVLGVDISPTAIERARAAQHQAGTEATFIVAHTREWHPERQFDLVISTYALGKGREPTLELITSSVAPGGTAYVVEFDETTEGLWPADDLASVDELRSSFGGFHIGRAEVLMLPHHHGDETTEWPMAVVVAVAGASGGNSS